MFRKFIRLLLDQRGVWTTEMAVTGVTAIDSVIPEYWADGIIPDGNRESFWGGLSGKEGSRMPIIDKTGPLKQKGDQITFSAIAQLMGAGRTGEAVLKSYEEILTVGTFTVTADVIRHAVAVSRKSTKQANFDEVQRARTLLTDWFGRKLDSDTFTAITGSSAVETLYAGEANSAVGSLNATDGDTFGMAEIEMLRMALLRQGATPLKVQKVNGRSVPVFGIAYGEIEEYNLNQNSTFVQAIRESFERFREGGKHPLFNGAVGMYRNMILYPYYSMLPIPQGTPLRPETTVYATLITSATTLSVGGATASSGSTADYTTYFASSGSLQVEDEILSYTSKTVNTFAGLTRGGCFTQRPELL